MATYSIKDLEQISGVKAHTIRIWEQRYSLLKPKRTDTNIRYYSGDDLKHLLNVCVLYNCGWKISKIAKMELGDVKKQVQDLCECSPGVADQVNELTLAMMDLDEARFERVINRNNLRFGFEKTMMEIIYPFFERVGVLWMTDAVNAAHEHFISNLIRQKVIVAIDAQPVEVPANADTYLLFLPEGELHELSLMFVWYLLRSRHKKVIYLGQSVPLEDLKAIYDQFKPRYMLTLTTSYPASDEIRAYLEMLSDTYPDAQLLVGGVAVREEQTRFLDNVTYMKSLPDFVNFLENP